MKCKECKNNLVLDNSFSEYDTIYNTYFCKKCNVYTPKIEVLL